MMRLILGILAALAIFYRAELAADGIGPNECPAGRIYLSVETSARPPWAPKDEKLLIAALIREPFGDKAIAPYLPRRSDGWTYISSESDRVAPGISVTNCFPRGNYVIRLEYYKRLPLIGDWLVAYRQYAVSLGHGFGRPVFASWTKPELSDHIAQHWPLFAVYASVPIFFAVTLIAFLRSLKNRLPHGKENGA